MKAYCTSQGNWQINFMFEGRYRTLYFGRRFNAALARQAAKVVNELLTVHGSGTVPEPDLLSRVGTLPQHH